MDEQLTTQMVFEGVQFDPITSKFNYLWRELGEEGTLSDSRWYDAILAPGATVGSIYTFVVSSRDQNLLRIFSAKTRKQMAGPKAPKYKGLYTGDEVSNWRVVDRAARLQKEAIDLKNKADKQPPLEDLARLKRLYKLASKTQRAALLTLMIDYITNP